MKYSFGFEGIYLVNEYGAGELLFTERAIEIAGRKIPRFPEWENQELLRETIFAVAEFWKLQARQELPL